MHRFENVCTFKLLIITSERLHEGERTNLFSAKSSDHTRFNVS